MAKIIDGVKTLIKGFFGIKSPSKVFAANFNITREE